MANKGTAGHVINIAVVLLLFCVFTTSVLMTLLSGAGAYQKINANLEEQFNERTCLAYLETKIHHYDTVGQVALEPFGDTTALVLYEALEGVRYKTAIYYHDGAVKELFFEDGLSFAPEDGQIIMVANDLQFTWKEADLLAVTCKSDAGTQATQLVHLQGGDEVRLHAKTTGI